MAKNIIEIKGARSHNLKNIDLNIPRDKFVVFTGVSGSGKSSLAFDTLYAEGQRRYVESLSSYARQFLGQMDKPDVDYIGGLSPAISIDQKTTNNNPRSTVGTVTEIYDYLRLLYARAGTPHCPKCGREIKKQTIDQIVDQIMKFPADSKIQILAPVVNGRKGEHIKLLDDAKKNGYVRVRIDGEIYDLSEEIKLEKNKKHVIEIVVDRLKVRDGIQKRLADSAETAAALSGGIIVADIIGDKSVTFSENFACPDCGISIPEIEPRSFSFNNPSGACPECSGLGIMRKFSPELIVPIPSLSISKGAINAPGFNSVSSSGSMSAELFKALSKKYNFSLDEPFENLSDEVKDIIFYGTKGEKIKIEYMNAKGVNYYEYSFDGVIGNLQRRYNETNSDSMRGEYDQYMTEISCPACHGKRLKPEILAVTVGDKSISEVTEMNIADIKLFFEKLELSEKDKMISEPILKEINARIGFLIDVGLDYLTLSRSASTLSGGESQRIRLATQIGSGLVGVVYILDEPSIGLHQRDNDKLISTLKNLRDMGNTLIVVEHDEDTMYAADYIVDIGPGAGRNGGEVVCAGTVEDIKACERSETGAYLSGRKKIEVPKTRRPSDKFIRIVGASENNLKNIDVNIPLGIFTCVTGVSGSGKSSLVNEILYKRLARDLNYAKCTPGKHTEVEGIQQLDKVIDIDQSPIGRTPRSNPATYTGLFDMIRDLYAQTNEAKIRGYTKGRFSFNVKGGRCEACGGDGIIKIEMNFLPDIYVPCDVCGGKRYNRETLEVKYKGKTISDVLDMTVEEALEFFDNIPKIKNKLQTLYDVGLCYVQLGQPSTTLSGGEAQRVKLATELSKKSTGKTMYILDEPTTGLHTSDVHRLIDILQRLTDGGNTVLVIEHNLDVIKTADYIIDLGPEGGSGGGTIVAAGTPEEITIVEGSYTGKYLKKYLK